MKSTGIVRKVDELGRIVLPIELRRTLGIEEKDRIEIFVENVGSNMSIQVPLLVIDRRGVSVMST